MAAQLGLRVAIIDRAEFPRDKPCGGGVNQRAARLLPFDLSPVVQRTCVGAHFSSHGRPIGSARSHSPITYLTRRRELDAFLLQHATDAGATLYERCPITHLETRPDGVAVTAGAVRFDAAVVVAADGAAGRTARLLGLEQRHHVGVALEVDLVPDRWPETFNDMLGFDLGVVPGGFGWLFPKGDHVNVGLGGWGHIGATLRRRIATQIEAFGVTGQAAKPVAHALTVRRPESPLTVGRVMLAGDAAGLVDPLLGEGINAAIESGIAAAEEAHRLLDGQRPDLEGYAARIRASIGADLIVALQLHDLVQVAPSLAAAALTHVPGMWPLGVRILRGELTYGEIRRSLGPIGAALEGLSRGAALYRHAHRRLARRLAR